MKVFVSKIATFMVFTLLVSSSLAASAEGAQLHRATIRVIPATTGPCNVIGGTCQMQIADHPQTGVCEDTAFAPGYTGPPFFRVTVGGSLGVLRDFGNGYGSWTRTAAGSVIIEGYQPLAEQHGLLGCSVHVVTDGEFEF